MLKRFFGCLICFIVISSVAFSAGGTEPQTLDVKTENEEISIVVNRAISIKYNDKYLKFYDALSRDVYPISYNGSTYLPVRAISGLFNTSILWNGLENKIYLDSSLGIVDNNSVEKIDGNSSKLEAKFDKGILNRKIKIDKAGVILSFKDEQGNTVFPISYESTTYLPVRALANVFHRSIYYESETNTVLLFDSEKELVEYTNPEKDKPYYKYLNIDDSFFDTVKTLEVDNKLPAFYDEKYPFNENNDRVIVLNKLGDNVIYIDTSKDKNDFIYSYNTFTKKTILITKLDKTRYVDKSSNTVTRISVLKNGEKDFGICYDVCGWEYIFITSKDKIYIFDGGTVGYLYMVDVTNKMSREIYRTDKEVHAILKENKIYILEDNIICVDLDSWEKSEFDQKYKDTLNNFTLKLTSSYLGQILYNREPKCVPELIFSEKEFQDIRNKSWVDYLINDKEVQYSVGVDPSCFAYVDNDTGYVYKVTIYMHTSANYTPMPDKLLPLISNYYYYNRETKEINLLNSVDYRTSDMISQSGKKILKEQFDNYAKRFDDQDVQECVTNSYSEIVKDYFASFGNIEKLKLYNYLFKYNSDGDDTAVLYKHYNWFHTYPVPSGEITLEYAILNDGLSSSLLQYAEDPVTGKNIYEDKIERTLKEIDAYESDILKSLKRQSINLKEALPSNYVPQDKYYFKLNSIVLNFDNEFLDYDNTARPKIIQIIVNDYPLKKVTLEDSKNNHIIDINYTTTDIENPIKVKILVLDTYKGKITQDIYIRYALPDIESNIPQGR